MKKYTIRHALAALFILCFIAIAFLMTKNMLSGFDDGIRYYFYNHRNYTLTKVLTFITHTGDWKTIVILALGILLWKKTRNDYGLPIAGTTVVSVAVYSILKMIFQRPRPDAALRLVEQGGFSFPSGHSMNCMMFYGMIIFLIWSVNKGKNDRRAVKIILSVIVGLNIIAIGLSRIYLGVHYPSDVLGGWTLAAALLTEAGVIYRSYMEKSKK